jgi:hypothetical protein
MAKISQHGGASDKTLPVPDTEDAAAAETVPVPEAAADQPEPETADVQGERGPGLVDTPHDDSVFPTAAEEEGDEEPESSSEQDYEAWTVEQLKEQLDKRGLPKTGKKDDLVLRLLEDDDTRTPEAGTE